jgi:hypothetical protein
MKRLPCSSFHNIDAVFWQLFYIACYSQLIFKFMYEQIKTKENYDKLLASGMFWEFHPELTGNWEVDKILILAS